MVHIQPGAPRQLQVVVTAGPEDLAKAAFAFETALSAVASSVQVHVFLVLNASKWACEPRRRTAQRVYDLIDQVTALGVTVTCCSTCVVEHCAPERWQSTPERRDGAGGAVGTAIATNQAMAVSGLTAFVEGVVAGIPTITF